DAEDGEDVDQPFAVDRPQHRAFDQLRVRRLAVALQQRLAEHEDDQARQHADAGETEAGPPAHGLPQQAAQDRGPEGPQVDAVIVEGEARIPAWIALWIQLADDRRDVRLQEADPHDDQRNGQVEDVDPVLIDGLLELIRALG